MQLTLKTIILASALCTGSAYAIDPQLSDTSCEQLGENLELTQEAKDRFADLIGTCEGVYSIDGHLYTRTQAIIRKKARGKVTLYLPATDHTFQVSPDPKGYVWVGGRKVRARSLNRGDRLGIYLSVEKFTQKKVDEVYFAAADDSTEEIVATPVEEIAALPTTASSLPLLALLSALLLGFGLLLRRFG